MGEILHTATSRGEQGNLAANQNGHSKTQNRKYNSNGVASDFSRRPGWSFSSSNYLGGPRGKNVTDALSRRSTSLSGRLPGNWSQGGRSRRLQPPCPAVHPPIQLLRLTPAPIIILHLPLPHQRGQRVYPVPLAFILIYRTAGLADHDSHV